MITILVLGIRYNRFDIFIGGLKIKHFYSFKSALSYANQICIINETTPAESINIFLHCTDDVLEAENKIYQERQRVKVSKNLLKK